MNAFTACGQKRHLYHGLLARLICPDGWN